MRLLDSRDKPLQRIPRLRPAAPARGGRMTDANHFFLFVTYPSFGPGWPGASSHRRWELVGPDLRLGGTGPRSPERVPHGPCDLRGEVGEVALRCGSPGGPHTHREPHEGVLRAARDRVEDAHELLHGRGGRPAGSGLEPVEDVLAVRSFLGVEELRVELLAVGER